MKIFQGQDLPEPKSMLMVSVIHSVMNKWYEALIYMYYGEGY